MPRQSNAERSTRTPTTRSRTLRTCIVREAVAVAEPLWLRGREDRATRCLGRGGVFAVHLIAGCSGEQSRKELKPGVKLVPASK